ncbi:unnamed protein product [Spirodela intermedia]|uniref:Peptidase A1 domain-containing protein n=1 Tax=Spirodela intermedia TaxID=51605 RepID=A0A7I8J484_SPIIN|nr:unnamed protein product [Spirodela intermedia]CAA6664854.1 unnamed protein product [Spirodela intermedia]
MVTATLLCHRHFLCIYSFFAVAVLFHWRTVAGDSLKLRLLHPSPPPTPQQALLLDSQRLSVLFSSLSSASSAAGKRPEPPIAIAAPVVSGASTGAGQYFVDFRVGTPQQQLLLVADTGSDLVWVRCSACRDCSRHPKGTAFHARRSSSFAPLHCYDRQCRLVPHPHPEQSCPRGRLHSPCRYRYSYADHSTSAGFFSRETATLNASSGQEIRIQQLSFGCAFNVSGTSVAGPAAGGAHGVMGLGRGPISFPSQVGRRYGNTFSYCLMDYTISPAPTSYLLIGDNRENETSVGEGKGGRPSPPPPLRYTPLQTNPLSPTFYYVGVEGASVDGVDLPIGAAVWAMDSSTGAGGTVIDSGTTLTFLPEPAYRQILAAMERRVRLPRVSVGGVGRGSSGPAFDLCVNDTGRRPAIAAAEELLHRHGARRALPGAAAGVLPDGFAVIGNLMQQGFLFVFDRDRSRLGFSRSGCAA